MQTEMTGLAGGEENNKLDTRLKTQEVAYYCEHFTVALIYIQHLYSQIHQ